MEEKIIRKKKTCLTARAIEERQRTGGADVSSWRAGKINIIT